jgi:hypothetical protein
MWQGFQVTADGSVYSWSGRGYPQDSTVVGSIRQSLIDSVWARVEHDSLFARSDAERANLTGWIHVADSSRRVDLYWPATIAPQPPTHPLEAFYRQVDSLLVANTATTKTDTQ